MIIEEKTVNSKIEGDAKLWRYMDFTKLVSLISTQSLYFCRSDKFKDVFEGKVFGLENKYKTLENVKYAEEEIKTAILSRARGLVNSIEDKSEVSRETTFINCWHLNEYESAAMWDLYLKSNEGIAIQTTFNKIKKSLVECDEGIIIGKVDYINHIKGSNYRESMVYQYFTKRLSFKHEEEVRLVYSETVNNKDLSSESKYIFGRNINVDISNLIERVYVSPDADPWFVDVVKVVLEKFDLDVEVIHSKLYELN
ncbi:DUF2971 domain-containing protein [Bacillus cereus]|uniref:DUF2971 domain-containing protein n=1 Tax=Bacillus cereus TaxID=1396 RepID=UPI0015CF78F0|nr:DUF2971 domain-containing protein [Bacillus cereus]